ncbi:hemagglutinin component of the neurotoxin complex domain protein (plasmid) [Clostridium botulinum]|nr:hemagglutinin component of the neurotoxin complex domain protein [Clostridium botulinum]
MEHYSVIQNSLNDKIVTISCKADTNLFFIKLPVTLAYFNKLEITLKDGDLYMILIKLLIK